MATDVSIALACCREGQLVQATLLSIERARAHCLDRGISSELIVTLDRADGETARIVREFPGLRDTDQVLEVDFGDLGMSRNAAVAQARGAYVAICDGDDLYAGNWFARCIEFDRHLAENIVLHPELVVLFDQCNVHSWQRDQSHPDFDMDCMLVINPWNSCCFARREIFDSHPYVTARPGETGFGYEDWHWNCETVAAGLVHRVVPGTVHLVRRKGSNSLNAEHARGDALIPPTALFGRFR